MCVKISIFHYLIYGNVHLMWNLLLFGDRMHEFSKSSWSMWLPNLIFQSSLSSVTRYKFIQFSKIEYHSIWFHVKPGTNLSKINTDWFTRRENEKEITITQVNTSRHLQSVIAFLFCCIIGNIVNVFIIINWVDNGKQGKCSGVNNDYCLLSMVI